MNLAIFDLDGTLLDGDSDHAWLEFMIECGLAENDARRRNDAFLEDYRRGQLDAEAWLRFCLEPMKNRAADQLRPLREEFLRRCMPTLSLPAARALIEAHRLRGDHLLLISSTHRFIVEPIALDLGLDEQLCTEPEIIDGIFTGRALGPAILGERKAAALADWQRRKNLQFELRWAYGDSINDLPLMEFVELGLAVNPDSKLESRARRHQWPILSLRNGPLPDVLDDPRSHLAWLNARRP